MKRLLPIILLIFSTSALGGVDSECRKNLIDAAKSFIGENARRLTGQSADQLLVTFKSFKNTTPGSYDQRYDVGISLEWPSKNHNHPFGLDLVLDFYSPFICEHLKLRGFAEKH